MLGFRRRLILSHLLVALLGGGALGGWLYFSAQERIIDAASERLLDSVRLLAQGLSEADLDGLAVGAVTAEQSPVQRRLADARRANPQLERVFVLARDRAQPRWLVASDAAALQDRGVASADEIALWQDGLHEPAVRRLGSIGRLTAVAPIGSAGTHGAAYALGASLQDGLLEERLRLLQLSSLLAFLASMLVALVLARVLAQRLHARLGALVARCHALASDAPLPGAAAPSDDEFGAVLAEFDAMAARLRTSQREREEALAAVTEANRLLEQRVRERTGALEAATEQLRGEIESRVHVEALLAEAALTDPLTGLLNRRAMLEMLEQALATTQGAGFCMLIADIDHFKRINDEFGHGTGDQALVAVAQVLDSMQGAHQRHASRWGGEEFLLLLPGQRLAEACRSAEELRRRIAELQLPVGGLRLTVSIGVAEYQPGEPLEDCLRRCDAALYRAKDGGRNAVVAARGGLFAAIS